MGTNAQKEYFRPSGRYGYEQNQHPGYRFRREIPVGITDLIQHRPDDQIRLLNDKPFYFQFGLMLHNKGGKVQATDGGSDIELSLNAMYLELPVMLNYHIRLAPKVAVIPFAGFYGSLGVDGKQSFDDLGLEIQQNLFGKNKMFQRGDFGGRIGIGLSIHSVYIGASYGGGFLNIAQEDDTSKFRNRSWSLSVGYDF